MGEKKISTLWIRVDLNCEKCSNKIRRVLCKYDCQIISKTFDEKNNLVIVTGYFHPCKFSNKLCCKVGKVIISIEEKKDEPAPEPPAPAPEPENPPPVVVVVVVEEVAPPPAEPETEPAPEPANKEPPPALMVVPYFIPRFPPLQFGVCCGPCYEGYCGGPCQQGYGNGMPVVPPPPAAYCDCGCNSGYRRCQTPCDCICEEDPNKCSIM
ncbi:hypothetical protein ACHQM5_021698 [Ranunculus cassubicifolius]